MRARRHVAAACAIAIATSPFISAHVGHDETKPAVTVSARALSRQPVVGDIPLVDQSGRATSLREVLATDEPVLVNFIFTTCTTLCPVMSAGFAQLQANLGARRGHVRLVSISVDPETDTVDKLRAYAARYEADRSWRFLTGSRAAVLAAQRAFGADRGDKSNHSTATYIRRAPGAPWETIDSLASAGALVGATRPDPRGTRD